MKALAGGYGAHLFYLSMRLDRIGNGLEQHVTAILYYGRQV